MEKVTLIKNENLPRRLHGLFNEGFIVDEKNRSICRLLSQYFSKNSDCEKFGINMNKGIILMGNVGTGKTSIMEYFMSLHQAPRGYVIDVNKVASSYQRNGDGENIDEYFGLGKNTAYMEASSPTIYCFDDLGIEPLESKHMGNSINVMGRIIQERYANRRRCPFTHTHFTTNLNKSQIKERYGERCISRLNEMCNFLVLEGEDRRT